MPTVWIPNKAGHDFSLAERYGNLQSITEGNINLVQVDRLLYTIAGKLSSAESHDLLILSGHVVLCLLSACILLTKFGFVNLLIFNAKTGGYTQRRISMGQMEECINQGEPSEKL